MKLVIDIPEDRYDEIVSGIFNVDGYFKTNLTLAFRNATPLTDCTDAISRSAVMKLLESRYSSDTIMSIYEEVLELPSVNPTRPKAKWIERDLESYNPITRDRKIYVCSNCHLGIDSSVNRFANYCPNCGAEMESEDKE